MKQATPYVGIDAHKREFIAKLIGQQKAPVTWHLANEAQAVRRLFESSSAKHRVPLPSSRRPARVATRCNGR